MAITISKIDRMSDEELQKYFSEDYEDENGKVIKNYRWKFLQAYRESKELDNQFLNFSGPIQEEDLMIECLKEFGIKNFTVSTEYSGHMKVFWAFQNSGFIAKGMIEVKEHGLQEVKKDGKTVDYLNWVTKPALYFSFE